MLALDVISKIKDYTGKEVNYQRETNWQERSVDEKQSQFRRRNIKTLAQVGTYPERVTFKKSENSL